MKFDDDAVALVVGLIAFGLPFVVLGFSIGMWYAQ